MSDIYEDPSILSEYLLFHYGTEEEILTKDTLWPTGMRDALDFAVRTTLHFSNHHVLRGLDLGCAVGRSTFEMSHHCENVLGLDFSHSFIAAAQTLQAGKRVNYERKDEAHIKVNLSAVAPRVRDLAKISFLQGDAMNLPLSLGSFDRVHAANLICRLSEPQKLLIRFADLVSPGGELVLATPCTWLEGFTPSKFWPSGSTLDWLNDELCDSFQLVKKCDEPFLIRETARKFQWTQSMVTVWQRR